MAASTSGSTPTLADSLFQRSLDDLIKSLRSSPDPSPILSRSLDDIRREIRSPDLDTKSVALHKLTYLHSIHHLDMSFASFHALHLLPSPSHLHKRLAYLAASLSFHPLTDVLLLITNQLRKDLSSSPSLALEFLAATATPDLSCDLAPDVLSLLSSRPSLRKKALASMLRILSRYPDYLRVALPRLVESLASPDPRILSAAVGAFCELSASDPRPLLPLAPEFYKILVDCKNNWVLIKVLKIFSRLAPLEPRLTKRIIEPVCEHMRRSVAKSLVFECIGTVLESLGEYEHAVKLAVEKMKEFLVAEDPNLRYLGLRALSMLGPMHSWAVEESREIVVKSLDDPDPNIQREALKLIMGLVCDSNVIDVCNLLVKQAARSDPVFANEILGAILTTCSRDFYELIFDFEWYIFLLGEISRNPHCAKGEEIERQLVDIGMRVKDARMELVQVARDLLIDPALLGNLFLYRILSAAAWIAGEYVEFSRSPIELVEALLQPRTSLLPTVVRAVYIHAVFKIIVFCYGSFLEGAETGRSQWDSKVGALGLRNDLKLRSAITCERYEGNENGSKCSTFTCHKVESFLDPSEMKGPFNYTTITSMLDIVKVALQPLVESDEVGVQERSTNVLGLVHILQEFQTCDLEKESPTNAMQLFEFVKLVQDSVSEEIGPIPVDAQERVPVPDGIAFLEDLSEIGVMLADKDAETSPSHFSLRVQHLYDSNEEMGSFTESTSLLAEHRKRHGLYYLQVDKEKTESKEYPRVNDVVDQGNDSTIYATEDLLKLTQKSLDPKKSRPVKSRPTVIKLDEENIPPVSSLRSLPPKKDLSSDIVPGVLTDDAVDEPSSSKKILSSKSSQRREKKSHIDEQSTSETKGKMRDKDHGSSMSKHKRRGKERHQKLEENTDVVGNSTHRSSRGDALHHHRQKHRQKTDGSLDVLPQTPVVQDFLL